MHLHQLTDSILLSRATRGDTEAFAQLYKRYNKKIYRFVFFKVHQTDIVEDIVHDVFIKFWQAAQRSESVTHVRAYLYSIARHTVIDYYRAQREQYNLEAIEHLEDTNSDLEQEIMTKSQVQQVYQKIKQLKPEYQEVLQLRYVEQLSLSEMASILEKSKGAVKVQLHRAQKKLRAQF